MRAQGLPLFILANWRGFSGGTRDMLDEVLKFGAAIVDELRQVCLLIVATVTHGLSLRLTNSA